MDASTIQVEDADDIVDSQVGQRYTSFLTEYLYGMNS
jgi:hypothetical protein